MRDPKTGTKRRGKASKVVKIDPKALKEYSDYIEDVFMKPLLSSKSGRHQLAKGLITPSIENLAKYGKPQPQIAR